LVSHIGTCFYKKTPAGVTANGQLFPQLSDQFHNYANSLAYLRPFSATRHRRRKNRRAALPAFPITAAQIEAFRDGGNEVMIRIDHPNYGHAGIVGDAVRAALGEDFG
jgi:hypothetical protein